MSAHDSPIDQHGTNTGAEGTQNVQKEIQKDSQMQQDVEELADILSSAPLQQQTHLFSKTRSPTRDAPVARKLPQPALPMSLKPACVAAPQQTTPANTKQPQAQKPKGGDANKDLNEGDESKPSAPKPQTVDLTNDTEGIMKVRSQMTKTCLRVKIAWTFWAVTLLSHHLSKQSSF